MTENNRIIATPGQKGPLRTRDAEEKVIWGERGEFPGVRFTTYHYEGVDALEKDGALIEIDPGERTPVQIVRAEKTFIEAPINGNLFLVSIKKGEIAVFHFDSSEIKGASFEFETANEEIMCWVASPNQQESAQVVETVEPGFEEGDLENIVLNTTELDGVFVPQELWSLLAQLQSGQTKDTIVPIEELSELF